MGKMGIWGCLSREAGLGDEERVGGHGLFAVPTVIDKKLKLN